MTLPTTPAALAERAPVPDAMLGTPSPHAVLGSDGTAIPSRESRSGTARAALAEGAEAAPGGDVSLLAAADLVRRNRGLITAVVAALVAAVLAFLLLRDRVYASESSFLPQTRSTLPGGLSGLASQFGVALPAQEPTQSPAFYVDLLRTPEALDSLILHRYAANGEARGRTLLDVYDVHKPTPALTLEKTRQRFLEDVLTSISQKTGVVTLTVRSESPALAQQVNRLALEVLNRFNQRARRTRASAEREFTERRSAEVRAELRAAEERLLAFTQSNREFNSASSAYLERDRLGREVTRLQSVYTTLSQALEQARIEEVRDTPLITVVEQPSLAAEPEPRGAVRLLAVALLGGFLLGCALAYLREALAAERAVRAARRAPVSDV